MRVRAKHRGYNNIYGPWGIGFPNDLRPTTADSPITWDRLAQNMEGAGATCARIKFVGWQHVLGTNVDSFEPPNWAGTHSTPYNDWNGNLQAMVSAFRNHGIKIHAILFDNQEWNRGWVMHAWNTRNGGFISDARDVFSNAEAIQAAKDRADAVIAACGDIVSCWEICAEMVWIMNPGWWGTDWAGMDHVMHNIVVPWSEQITQHIKSQHFAPVGGGHIITPSGSAAIRNEAFRAPSLDFALVNWYDVARNNAALARKMAKLRAAQAYAGRPVYVEQYAPWSLGTGSAATYVREPDDMRWSKAHEWCAACGEFGFNGPMRWPEAGPCIGPINTWWGVTHPNMAEAAGVTATMASEIDLSEWTQPAASWDNNIVSAGAELVSSCGDGAHVTAFLGWGSGGDKNIEFSGIADDEYDVHIYDYISGLPIEIRQAMASSGKLVLQGVPTTDSRCAIYIERRNIMPDPEPDPEPEAWEFTATVRGVSSLGNEVVLQGTLQEV